MFWSYFLTPTFYVPTTPLLMMSSNSPVEGKQGQTSLKCAEQSGKGQIQNLFLNITEEDLEKAGYENKKRPWSQEEDQILKNAYERQDKDWIQIANLLPGRNDKMCYSRYQRLKNQTKVQWKKADNDKLVNLVSEFGENWKQINKHFQKRNPKQIKEHYLNYVRPGIKKDDWTLLQDLKLVEYLNKYGTDWKILEDNFEGRTQNQIKNRYFGRLKKLAEKKQERGGESDKEGKIIQNNE